MTCSAVPILLWINIQVILILTRLSLMISHLNYKLTYYYVSTNNMFSSYAASRLIMVVAAVMVILNSKVMNPLLIPIPQMRTTIASFRLSIINFLR